jgi:hypothetical protein
MASALRVRRDVALEAARAVSSTRPIGGLLMGPMDAFGKETI